MADPPPYPDTGGGTCVGPGRGSTTGAPGWAKVLGIIAAVLVVLIVIMVLTELLTGQGPARHMFGGHMPLPGGHTP